MRVPGLRRKVLAVGVLVVLCSTFLSSGTAHAQRADIFSGEGGEACRNDPHSEECICREVVRYAWVPNDWEEVAGVPSYPPVAIGAYWDDEIKSWVPQTEGDPDKKLDMEANSKYKAHCSLAYFRENLTRLWYFLLALGGTLAGVSIAWAGFVHMQESVSGETRSMSRTMIIRTVLGVILLACVFFAWQGVSDLFLGEFEIWSDRPGLLEGF